MLGDIGGVMSILITTITFIFNPFIQFNLKFAYFRKLYKIKSLVFINEYQNSKHVSKILVSPYK